jgi:hypothetical protein
LKKMISPQLKSDASPHVVALVQQTELRCDGWADNLTLLGSTHDVAVWGELTQIIDLVEQQIKQFGHGSQQQREAMISLGRAGARLLDKSCVMKLSRGDSWLRWTSELREINETGGSCSAQLRGVCRLFRHMAPKSTSCGNTIAHSIALQHSTVADGEAYSGISTGTPNTWLAVNSRQSG